MPPTSLDSASSTESTGSLHVFLSHTYYDRDVVRTLCRMLSVEDWIEAWLDDEDILPGQWPVEVQKAIRRSDVIIACLSGRSVNKYGWIQEEIEYALNFADNEHAGTLILIGLKLERCILPDRLRGWPAVGLFGRDGYTQLLNILRLRARAIGIKVSHSTSDPGEDQQIEEIGARRYPFGLTHQEMELLRLIAAGLNDAQAAGRLQVSLHTVDDCLNSIISKLGVKSRGEACRFALEQGLA
jgi:DNA-binding CsgD family transcriptional regulator